LSDCYDWLMNLATPIIIYHDKDDFRSLLRDMLTRHGFFHLLEASSTEELISFMRDNGKKKFFLIQGSQIEEALLSKLAVRDDFIVLAQPESEMTLTLATRLGAEKILSFPFSSEQLYKKISKIS
jgi:DNA-binding NtrC family response regulator